MYFLETLQVRAPCHGGVLYSFWYWWNVVWIFYEFFKYWKKKKVQYFMFSSRFMLYPGGGGGGEVLNFFFRKTILSYFTFYAIFNIKKIETPRLSVRPSRLVYWLNGRWFLQIPVVDRDSWNLYPLYPLFPCSDWGGGGGAMFFSWWCDYQFKTNCISLGVVLITL